MSRNSCRLKWQWLSQVATVGAIASGVYLFQGWVRSAPATRMSDGEVSCPADVETLTALLLEDLPAYANRTITRSRLESDTLDTRSFFIVAGQADFEPLPLDTGTRSTLPPTGKASTTTQIFFTTLERQYSDREVFYLQSYHWLFLTRTMEGWRMALLYSRIGSPRDEPPLPPRETSEGVVGVAIADWLRDCRAGSIRR